MPAFSIQSVADLQDVVRAHGRVHVRGGGSKPALSTPADDERALLDLSALSGVLAYDPHEFTFTARAGTPVRQVQAMLAEEGQYLPFDPPLAEAGATLGGVVAAGTNGPGRYRYGGVRDFLIGIRFVDGRGEEIRGGGQVVKNAAGFDFPKLMVGSLGRLGALTEVTFKVFPAPPALSTLRATFTDRETALDALVWLTRSQFDLDAVDLAPQDHRFQLWVRLGGLATALAERTERLASLLHERFAPDPIDLFAHDEDPPYWRELATMSWRPADSALVKVPVTPKRIRELDPLLAEREVARRYSSGGTVAWIAWDTSPVHLHALLQQHRLAGVVLDGPPGRPWLGTMPGVELVRRIAATIDPENKFDVLSVWSFERSH